MGICIGEGDWENPLALSGEFLQNVLEGRQPQDDHSCELEEGSKGLGDESLATSFPFPRTLNAR